MGTESFSVSLSANNHIKSRFISVTTAGIVSALSLSSWGIVILFHQKQLDSQSTTDDVNCYSFYLGKDLNVTIIKGISFNIALEFTSILSFWGFRNYKKAQDICSEFIMCVWKTDAKNTEMMGNNSILAYWRLLSAWPTSKHTWRIMNRGCWSHIRLLPAWLVNWISTCLTTAGAW